MVKDTEFIDKCESAIDSAVEQGYIAESGSKRSISNNLWEIMEFEFDDDEINQIFESGKDKQAVQIMFDHIQ